MEVTALFYLKVVILNEVRHERSEESGYVIPVRLTQPDSSVGMTV
jgi:hypothetical protein